MTYEQYLMHHGIMGQKCGVRRYQNPDGSLTAAGRERYLKDGGGLTEEGKKYFSKGPSRAQKKAYKNAYNESFARGMEAFDQSERGKKLNKKRTELELEQEEEFYKDPDAFDYGNGTKRSQQIDRELASLSKQYDDGLNRAIVEDLMKTYSTQEIRWLEQNTLRIGRRASMKILSEYEKMSVSDIKNSRSN